MRTRLQARLRSASLPPPPTTLLAGVIQSELADGSASEPSQRGEMHDAASGVNNPRVEEPHVVSVRDEHPFRAGPSNDVERLLNLPVLEVESGKSGLQLPRSELESHDSGSKIIDDDVF